MTSSLDVFSNNTLVNLSFVVLKSIEFGHYSEMSSFNESKGEKLINTQSAFLHRYNLKQFTRVYPNGMRVDSSNFDPIKFWNMGIQLVALNYQTGDKSMQLNQARFLLNGSCGYVLKPEILLDPNFDVFKNEHSKRAEPQIVSLRVGKFWQANKFA